MDSLSASDLLEQKPGLNCVQGTLMGQYFFDNRTLYVTALGAVCQRFNFNSEQDFSGDGMYYKGYVYAFNRLKEQKASEYTEGCTQGCVSRIAVNSGAIHRFELNSIQVENRKQCLGIIDSCLLYIKNQHELWCRNLQTGRDVVVYRCDGQILSIHSYNDHCLVCTRSQGKFQNCLITQTSRPGQEPHMFTLQTQPTTDFGIITDQDSGHGVVLNTNNDIIQVSTGKVLGSAKTAQGAPLPKPEFSCVNGCVRQQSTQQVIEKEKLDYFKMIVPHEAELMNNVRSYTQVQKMNPQQQRDFYLKAFYVSAFIAEQLGNALNTPIYPLIVERLEQPNEELVKQTCRLSRAHEVLQWRPEVLFCVRCQKWTRQWFSLTARKVLLGYNQEQMSKFIKAFAESNWQTPETEQLVFKMQDKLLEMRRIKSLEDIGQGVRAMQGGRIEVQGSKETIGGVLQPGAEFKAM